MLNALFMHKIFRRWFIIIQYTLMFLTFTYYAFSPISQSSNFVYDVPFYALLHIKHLFSKIDGDFPKLNGLQYLNQCRIIIMTCCTPHDLLESALQRQFYTSSTSVIEKMFCSCQQKRQFLHCKQAFYNS